MDSQQPRLLEVSAPMETHSPTRGSESSHGQSATASNPPSPTPLPPSDQSAPQQRGMEPSPAPPPSLQQPPLRPSQPQQQQHRASDNAQRLDSGPVPQRAMSELSQNQEVVVDTPPTKKRKTRSSDVWQYFNIEGDGIVCQQCGKSYKRNTSTYSLRYHLVKTHHISSNHSASTSAVSSDSFRSEKADELLAVYLCKNALGPDTVLQTSFAELMAFLEPKWVVSTPHGLQDHVFPALRAKITEHLRHTLSDVKYMSLSLETWVAMSDSRFVAVSVHGINHSFEFKSFLLEVAAVPILASADFIAHFVQRVLAQWGIELERVTAGSHNGSGEFAENCRSAIENNLGLLWVNCIASTLNKAVRGGLQAETIASTVARAESLCKFFLCSAQAGKVLQEQHKRLEGASLPLNVNIPSSNSASTPTSLISVPLNNIGNTGGSSSSSSSSLGKYKEGTLLYLDTSRATSWVSAYKMITHLLRSQASVCAALSILASANTATEVPVIPSEAEWLILGSIAAVVKPIYHATKFISVQRYPSMSGVIPVMERLLTHHLAITPTSPEEMNVGCSSTQLGGGADTTVADAPLHEGVAKALQESIAHEISNEWKRFDVNTVSDTMLLAVYLDPRLKDFAFVADENDRASLIQRAASLVERLIFSPDAPSCRGNIAGISDPMCVDNGPGQQEKWAGLLGPLAEDVPDQHAKDRESLEKYRRKKCYPFYNMDKVNDPLLWWKVQQTKYTKLCTLAMRFLSIAASSIPCDMALTSEGYAQHLRRKVLMTNDATTSNMMFVCGNVW